MYKFIRVSFAHAYYGNPNVGQGSTDVKEGDGYQTDGIEISPDHRYIFVEPHHDMKCRVTFFEGEISRLLNLRHIYYSIFKEPIPFLTYRNIEKKTRLSLSKVSTVGFDNDWDDSCYSFHEITAEEFVPDNRTRRVFDEHQILSPDQLVRGRVIIYHHWNSGIEKTVPKKMVILEGESADDIILATKFKGLFLNEDGTTWEFWPFCGDCSVVPYEKGYYHNKSYLVDTGETMTEEQIITGLTKKQKSLSRGS